ncbi:MAG: redox-regulated ATPase YchF, partial [Planctomycetes bacterium]|nr:redox-regulated ATPase YchF [Planctomycetota bacterium]
MGFKCGIVGLPNVGKSTIFNALTNGTNAAAANFPFCTIEPNVGMVAVPDPRIQALVDIVKPQNVVPASMRFVDIAGLVRGASKGEGLGNAFLGHIREVEAIAHVVRCFEDEDVIHVDGKVNPVSDIETINAELALKDLETVDKVIQREGKNARSGDKGAKITIDCLTKVREVLDQGKPARTYTPANENEEKVLRDLFLLTNKKTLYVANVREDEVTTGNAHVDAVRKVAEEEGAVVVVISGKIEAELAAMPAEERQEFLKDMGLEESGLNALIREGYRILGLRNYFTAGVKEVRSWTIHEGETAPQAAGVIHT